MVLDTTGRCTRLCIMRNAHSNIHRHELEDGIVEANKMREENKNEIYQLTQAGQEQVKNVIEGIYDMMVVEPLHSKHPVCFSKDILLFHDGKEKSRPTYNTLLEEGKGLFRSMGPIQNKKDVEDFQRVIPYRNRDRIDIQLCLLVGGTGTIRNILSSVLGKTNDQLYICPGVSCMTMMDVMPGGGICLHCVSDSRFYPERKLWNNTRLNRF